jgi:glycosyltransferase involved in cell wall biosynthesis
MGCGKPVVTSPVGMNTEIVTDQHNGFLADSDEEWVDSLSQLDDDRKLAIELGKNGRQVVPSQYSLQTTKYQWIELLRKTV